MLNGGICKLADHASFWGLAVAYQKPLSIHIPAKYQHISNAISEIIVSIFLPTLTDQFSSMLSMGYGLMV